MSLRVGKRGRLAARPRNEAEPTQIHVKAEIVVAVAAVPACVLVAETLHRSGKEAEVGKLAESKVNAARKVRYRFERYPSHAALVERLHRAILRPHMQSVCGTHAHIASRFALRATRPSWFKMAISTESRPVLETFPQCPSRPKRTALC